MKRTWTPLTVLMFLALAFTACQPERQSLTIYSSRTQALVHPVLEAFAKQYDVDVRVRYASTASLVATIQEEGENSPADVVYMAEPGGLGALIEANVLTPLAQDLLDRVDPRMRSPQGLWVGTSGRAKTVAYNIDTVDPADLPDSIFGFTDPRWKGRIGWAPRHAEFQELVTAIRKLRGDERAREWLQGIKANDPISYPNLISTVQGVANGEVDVGLVNHYYIPRFIDEQGEGFKARNKFLQNGGPGSLVTVAGVGILKTSDNQDLAERFVEFLLSEEAQTYFAEQTKEYPVAAGVAPVGDLPSLEKVDPPSIDLSNLADLQGTVQLMREVGALN